MAMASGLDDPVILQIRGYGFSDPAQEGAAIQTYWNLTKATSKVEDVRVHPCTALRMVFLTASFQGSPLCILPLSADTHITMELMDRLLQHLPAPEDISAERLTLALVDSDGTSSYYHIHRGIHLPPQENRPSQSDT